jgi:hypothetical protein
MNDDLTPINARPKRRPPEAFEDLSLALRDRVIWPVQDRFLALSDSGRAAVAGCAVVLALGIGIGGYSLASSDGTEPTAPRQVAAAVEPAPAPEPVKTAPAPAPKPEPTLQGAAPVFKAKGASGVGGSKAIAGGSTPNAATSSQTGNAATDTISSKPSSDNASTSTSASASASASTSTSTVKGPPAGPAGVAVARKFAQAFVVYETGGDKAGVRRDFAATATSELTRALMRRPPRQPANVAVPKAKVLNVVPAPSQGKVFPVSVSLLRVGATSELRLEMEQLKNKQWRVVNVLG